MENFEYCLIVILFLLLFINYCSGEFKQNRYRSELLEPSVKTQKAMRKPKVMPKLHDQPSDIQYNNDYNKEVIEKQFDVVNDMTTGGKAIGDIDANAMSVGKLDTSLFGLKQKTDHVSGVYDSTLLDHRKAFKMDNVQNFPLVKAYQEQVFGTMNNRSDLFYNDPRMNNVSTSGGGKHTGSVTVHIVWADWCGYSNKAMEAWPKMKSMIGNNHMGININYKDILEKDNKHLIGKGKKFDTTGFPYVFVIGIVNNRPINEKFNAVDAEPMAKGVKGILENHANKFRSEENLESNEESDLSTTGSLLGSDKGMLSLDETQGSPSDVGRPLM
uniref:Thioredoxin domain-containing protein n=1 Tax=viral metagenome TaxID=1070528 RepID=A0A6C0CY24_9ZZZZ